MKEHEERGATSTINSRISGIISTLLFGGWSFSVMKSPAERARIRQETENRARDIINLKWQAYKTVKAGGTFYIGDKGLYKSVRTRLKRMTDSDQLERFRLLVDKP